MSGSSRAVVAIALVAIITSAAPRRAHAQAVEAESLFQEGRRLLKEGKIGEACDKFEASERIEGSIGTLLNVADCREKNGQLATAWATFLKAAAASKRAGNDGKREAEARRRARTLEPRLAYLTISVPEASKVEGLVVSRNGAAIDPGLWNQGVPVDAGAYEITGQAPGHEAWSTRVTIDQEGQRISVEVPRFKQLEAMVTVVEPTVAEPIVVVEAVAAPVVARPGRFTTLRKVSVGVAVLGLASIGGGVAFGMKARDLQGRADRLCPEEMCGNPEAVRLNGDARDQALKTNLLLGAGGVAVAGAVLLWVIGAPDAIAPVVERDQVGVAYAGSF